MIFVSLGKHLEEEDPFSCGFICLDCYLEELFDD